MKVNFDAALMSLDGAPLKAQDKELTLKGVCVEALMMITPGDERVSGADKFKRYELAMKVNAGGGMEITPEEAAMLKERVGVVYGPAVIGPAYKLLNG